MKKVVDIRRAPHEGRTNQELTPGGDLAPLVAIGGLLTVKRLSWWYRPLLGSDTTSPLSADERFVAPPRKGIAKPEVIRAELTEKLEELYERLGRKRMFVVGHSLGGLLATESAVERPDLVKGVVSLAGVHAGHRENAATTLLRHMVGNPDEAKHLKHDSPYILAHKERMAEEWPNDVPLHVVSTPLDLLIVPPQGYGLKLPHGKRPEERLVVSPIRGVESFFRFTKGIPSSVQALKSLYFTEHLGIPLNPDVIDYIDASRRAASLPDTPIKTASPDRLSGIAA